MVVDLRAPFGPTKPVTCPGWTVNVIPSNACAQPNRWRSPSISIVAFMDRRCRSPGTRRICPRAHPHAATVCPQAYARRQTTRQSPGGYDRRKHDPAGWRRP
jgi:hypothetical protein